MNWAQWLQCLSGWKETSLKLFNSLKIVEYSGLGSVLPLWFPPLLLARYWPLAYLLDWWLYDTILVESVTEGQAARARVCDLSLDMSCQEKMRQDESLMNQQEHVGHAKLSKGGGGRAASWNCRWKNKTTTCFPWILFLAQILLWPTGMWSHYIQSP